MNKILICVLLAIGAGSAYGQTVTTVDEKDKAPAATQLTPEQKSADAFCLRETGSHLLSMKPKPHNDRAVECVNSPGRVYSREDIDRTGAFTTADALKRLDPSIH